MNQDCHVGFLTGLTGDDTTDTVPASWCANVPQQDVPPLHESPLNIVLQCVHYVTRISSNIMISIYTVSRLYVIVIYK
jgi:hypothetical protein